MMCVDCGEVHGSTGAIERALEPLSITVARAICNLVEAWHADSTHRDFYADAMDALAVYFDAADELDIRAALA